MAADGTATTPASEAALRSIGHTTMAEQGANRKGFCRSSAPFLVVPLVLVSLGIGACSDEDEQASANKRRYCELARELGRRAEGAFMDLPSDAPPEQVAKAYEYFLSSSAREFDEIQRVAPAEIRDQARTQIAAQRRAAGGDVESVRAVVASGNQVREYEDEECHRQG